MLFEDIDIIEEYARQVGVYPDPDELADYLYPYEKDIDEWEGLPTSGCYRRRKLPGMS